MNSVTMRRSFHLSLLVPAGAVVLLAAGCGSDRPAARVAGTPIANERVSVILEHAQEEARHEGRVFPARDTAAYEQARREALDLLIYHEELAKKADQLGVTVADDEIEARLEQGAEEKDDGEQAEGIEEGEENGAFAKESMRAALLYQRLYRRVTRDIRVKPAEVAAYYSRRARVYRTRGLALADARAEIVSDLLNTKRTAAMAQWVARMRREFAPQITYERKSA